MDEKTRESRIPTIHIVADTIPQAQYRILKTLHEKGFKLRTEYDRTNPDGSYMDPPSRDARVLVEVKTPFAQPRFSRTSYSEVGKYLAEVLGAKDHLVVPHKKLLELVSKGHEFEATDWPYCYHQRLTAYPCSDGRTINQLELAVKKLARDPISRRAVAITGVPEIDLFLKSDTPCLRELQFRATEDRGALVLHTFARWRSRDSYKAWGDNTDAITDLVQIEVAEPLSRLTGKKVIIGPYSEENGSLHIYGQDYTTKGMDKFFEVNPTEEEFLARSMTSSEALDLRILPELEELRGESSWRFPPKSLEIIDMLINGFKSGKFIP